MPELRVSRPYSPPSTKLCMKFLFAVVNADDRSSTPHLRSRFVRVYRDWFARRHDPFNGESPEGYYREVCNWWREPESIEKITVEAPDAEFGFEVVILRRKLKVVWSLADMGDERAAKDRIHLNFDWLDRYSRGPYDAPNEDWRLRLMAANSVLESVVSRLKICGNPKCKNKYFIRETQRKYCSVPCRREVEGSLGLDKIEPTRPKRLTEAGRLKISKAVKKRWKKYRLAKMRQA